MNKRLGLGAALLSALVISCSSSTDSGDASTPAGRVTAFTECKRFLTGAVEFDVAPSQDCLEYEYDGDSVLVLRHINAGFNCCPDSFTAAFDFEGQHITITETEWLSHPCHCLCLYDIDLRIAGLRPGVYTITVAESYLWQGAEPLELTVDLMAAPTGGHCVSRDRYPWGEPGNR